MSIKYDVYLAAPWFNSIQRASKDKIISVLENLNLSYYNPEEDEFNQLPRPRNKEQMLECYRRDIKAIEESKVIVCSTVQMDSGTLLEMGYALALNKRVIEYNDNPEDIRGCRNLMLVGACEGRYAQSPEDLLFLLRNTRDHTTKYDDNIKDVDIL